MIRALLRTLFIIDRNDVFTPSSNFDLQPYSKACENTYNLFVVLSMSDVIYSCAIRSESNYQGIASHTDRIT